MGSWARDLYSHVQNPVDFKMSNDSAAIVEGSVVMKEATQTNGGELAIATTTAALNAFGCAMDVGVYSATKGATEGIVRTSPNPFAVWKFRVSGTSTRLAALASASPGQIITNTTASTTGLVITAAEVGTIDMSGGIVKGRTGANAGLTRKQTSHNNNTDTNVVVPFPNTIAVGDTFIRLPYSKTCIAVQMVGTSIDEANGAIAFGSGIPMDVEEVIIDETRDQAWVLACFRTHFHNSLA